MPFSKTLERTLALIKPDAVKAEKVREILQLTEEAGFTVVDHRRLWVSSTLINSLMHIKRAVGPLELASGEGGTHLPFHNIAIIRAAISDPLLLFISRLFLK